MTTLNGDCRIGSERLCALPGERLDLFQTVARNAGNGAKIVHLAVQLYAGTTQLAKSVGYVLRYVLNV